ncbi:hypothetical protein RHMOL_Rhmol04G0201500 [Rhododendron molle]|uniref:Uncharacterized protein n=1 Tax=Rhododendron molle TaxID=49168 RepID=A0ACC0P3P3_RHOML|nr:hypothetical protein RHMOL_Rhmol04G0201500 [Rhododendron molle]
MGKRLVKYTVTLLRIGLGKRSQAPSCGDSKYGVGSNGRSLEKIFGIWYLVLGNW